MSYSFKLKIDNPKDKQVEPDREALVVLLKEHSNQPYKEIRNTIYRIIDYDETEFFMPKNKHNGYNAHDLAKNIRAKGLTAEVTYAALSNKLPYLVDPTGVVPKSEPISTRLLSIDEAEKRLDDPNIKLVLGEYGVALKWIPTNKKKTFWQEYFTSKNQRQDCSAFEWKAKSGDTFLLLWGSQY